MAEQIASYKHYVILDDKRKKNIVVVNKKGKHEHHSHFYRKTDKKGKVNINTAMMVIKFCDNKRTDMKSEYIFKSVMRLTNDMKYKDNLKRIYKKRFKDRQNYYNPMKGVR